MSEQLTLPAEQRERAGKGASRELRRSGRVPAVIYGDKKEPLSVHVEEKLLTKMLSNGHFMNTVVMIDAAGQAHRTLPKDVQFHPVTSRPIHVDFLRIGEHSQVAVNVPVNFIDEETSPGIKRGGVLNIVRHELELVCDAAEIPDQIDISLNGLDIGDSIHISSVELPKGSRSAIEDRDFTIATVVAPSAMKSEEGDSGAAGDAPAGADEAGDNA
jgi:large subunit ribosomal protein L25